MKLRNILAAVLVTFTVVSCKKEAETKPAEETAKEAVNQDFEVTLNVTVPKDDSFQLFYTEDNSLNFGEDKEIRKGVTGSATPQDVVFTLPKDVLPTQIRFDLGENVEQTSITVNSVKITYMNNVVNHAFGPGHEAVTSFFYIADPQMKYDAATGAFALLNPKGLTHDPLMWSNEILVDEMVKLYKK